MDHLLIKSIKSSDLPVGGEQNRQKGLPWRVYVPLEIDKK